ncbi:MAG TPA: lipase maturation factor family protein [Acidimicrobiia bacterium]|nr:lipase maturation factor family protein [Acidimicrobiia bacterium]
MPEFLDPPDYQVARLILQRGIAAVYLIGFLNVRNQFRPLLGENGLLPVPRYLAVTTFRSSPSLFHWRYSDRLVAVVAWAGMGLSAALAFGVGDRVPLWAGMMAWLVLWALYLSVVNVGQTFYGFGWESLLLEAGFYAAFLGRADVAPPFLVILAFRWLLFRVEFGAGMIKMRGDRCWRDLTCLDFHHETQPMPGPTSRWFHHLTTRMHKTEVLANHFAQLVVPFALFLPQPVAGIAGAVVIVTQGYLVVSGNYAWLNWITLLLGFSAIPDSWYAGIGPVLTPVDNPPIWFTVGVVLLGVLVIWLSRRPVMNLIGNRQLMNFSFNRLHLVNAYGAFGSVTRARRELIIEGSVRPDPGDGDWRAYEFKGKPGDPQRRPPQWAPYHLRLDWLMWFVPLSPSYGRGWLDSLVTRLLEADPATLRLLRYDPFDGARPTLIRGRLVDYRFSTRAEKRATGAVWVTGASRTMFGPLGRTDG